MEIQPNYNFTVNYQKELKVPQIRPKSKKLKRKFKIIAIVVLFTVHFPKFSKSFTIMRFNAFLKMTTPEKILKNEEELFVVL